MSPSSRKPSLPILVLLGIIAAALPEIVTGVSVGNVVTPKFFNGIKSAAPSSCKGKKFYTRAAFLNAAKSFPSFGHRATTLASKREIAAFFAHATYETTSFCYIEDLQKLTYCNRRCRNNYGCRAGKKYYGRGPFLLTWNCNYGAVGSYLGLDLLGNPGLVSTNPTVSFKTALWFWNTRMQPVLKNGFGATIKVINGNECNGGNPIALRKRISYYKKYCAQFGITPGSNLSC